MCTPEPSGLLSSCSVIVILCRRVGFIPGRYQRLPKRFLQQDQGFRNGWFLNSLIKAKIYLCQSKDLGEADQITPSYAWSCPNPFESDQCSLYYVFSKNVYIGCFFVKFRVGQGLTVSVLQMGNCILEPNHVDRVSGKRISLHLHGDGHAFSCYVMWDHISSLSSPCNGRRGTSCVLLQW